MYINNCLGGTMNTAMRDQADKRWVKSSFKPSKIKVLKAKAADLGAGIFLKLAELFAKYQESYKY